MNHLKTIWTTLLALISLTTFGQRDLIGYYSSNVADNGFFITKLELNTDSTFKYEFYGDLLYDRGTGKYRLKNKRTILVTFDKDSLDILGLGRATNRPVKFLFRKGRIYEHKTNGELLKRGRAFSQHKKYIFFGERYITTRKMYLKKRDGNLKWIGEENASR